MRRLGVVLGGGALWGAVDVLLLSGVSFADATVALRYAAAGAVVTAVACLVAALAWWRGAVGVALVLPPALVVLRHVQRALTAPVLSAAGLGATAAVLLPAAGVAVLLGRRLRAERAGAAGGAAFALALVASLALGGGGAHPRDLVLVSIDSVRADVWERYLRDGASDALRDFVSSSRRFEQARTTWSHSLPSHASMLTGLYADRHGARVTTDANLPGTPQVGSPLLDGVETVAEQLAAEGYQTAAFCENAWLGAPYGLERGFQTHVNGLVVSRLGIYSPRLALGVSSAGAMVEYALARLGGGLHPTVRLVREWLARRDPDRPAFLFVHFIEMHVPNDPPEALRARFASGPYADWGGRRIEAAVEAGELSPPAVNAQLHALSLASLAAMDRRLAPLWADLPPEALVLVAADHGDDLFEKQGIYGHAGVWEPVARVPLLARGLPPGRDASPVSLADVGATLLATAGLSPEGLDGVDLRAGVDGERLVLVEGHDPDGPGLHRAAAWRGQKLVAGEGLYDLAADPAETLDLSPERPEVARRLQGFLDGRPVPPDRWISTSELPDEVQEGLRELGYLE